VVALGSVCRRVHVSEPMESYILALVRATRESPAVALGASPRGTLALYRCSQALAAMRGRGFVIPDDVQALVVPTLAHRLMPSGQSRLRGKAVTDILREVTTKVPVPVEEAWSENAA
jgi:MoxR-like ATPase